MVETASKVNGFMVSNRPEQKLNRVHERNVFDCRCMIVQIYEIQTPDQADAMIDLGVDHIGSVILSADAWKCPEIKETVGLVQNAGCKSSLIPLFRNRDVIAQLLDYYRPDILHLCDTLPVDGLGQDTLEPFMEAQQSIRTRFPGIDIMRSIPVANNGFSHLLPSVELARYFEWCSDWLLIDTLLMGAHRKDQPVDGYVGITGRTCDWATAAKLVDAVRIPVILAGGLGPGNVYDAVLKVQPAGIDSCTNTNAVDATGHPIRFHKDTRKVHDFMMAVNRATAHLGMVQ
jgi:phosphoribosylanthranilate isomerase